MKKILIPIIAAAFFFAGCDYVEVPTQTGGTSGGGNGVTRRVLLEEFTGHTCIACPAGAATIEQLHGLYDDQLITIAIHHGWFAEPCPPHPLPNGAQTGSFSEDFTTGTTSGEGYEYEVNFPAVFSTLPNGMVNRLGFPSGTYPKSQGEWGTLVDSLIQIPASADLEITHTYSTSSRALSMSIDGQFIDAQNGTFNVAVMLTEDSLVGWQIDGTVYIPNFVFMHVLRACVNTPGSIIGTPVMTGSINANSSFTWTLPASYTVDNAYNANHCRLIAILYNTATMEVLQAAEAKLVP